jgi:hypothetical protein
MYSAILHYYRPIIQSFHNDAKPGEEPFPDTKILVISTVCNPPPIDEGEDGGNVCSLNESIERVLEVYNC